MEVEDWKYLKDFEIIGLSETWTRKKESEEKVRKELKVYDIKWINSRRKGTRYDGIGKETLGKICYRRFQCKNMGGRKKLGKRRRVNFRRNFSKREVNNRLCNKEHGRRRTFRKVRSKGKN